MNEHKLKGLLKPPILVELFSALPSTNTHLLAQARAGAPHGSAVIALSQTAGRGRRGRTFFSPPGGLYLSLLVDSLNISPGQLTTLAAVVAADSLERQHARPIQIKWVNDLLQGGLKVGGILCEGVLIDGQLSKSVIGIGLNTAAVSFPMELTGIAGSLHTQDQPLDIEQLAADILHGILFALPQAPAHLAAYRARCLTLGQQVRFTQGERIQTGLAVDVDIDGALFVRTEDGLTRVISGDVSLLS